MKLYVVLEESGYDYESAHVYGVYDSRELAEKEIEKQYRGEWQLCSYQIVESELNYVRNWG